MPSPSRPIVELGPGDLTDALALSTAAGWNQNEADWRLMLELGRAWGVRGTDNNGCEVLAASTLVLPYGGRFAWISMVLVLPEFRRRGLATVLLRHALGELAGRGLLPVLDATPDGRAVYRREGFVDTWGYARYRRADAAAVAMARAAAATAVAPTATVAAAPADSGAAGPPDPIRRALRDDDWPAIEAIDTPAFGASRIALLRRLARRLPQAARVVEAGGRLRGYVLGRDGREASQIGPLLADDPVIAEMLLDDALRRIDCPVQVDLLDAWAGALRPWLVQRGFALQRPFTRMVRGADAAVSAPGDTGPIVLVAGPELG